MTIDNKELNNGEATKEQAGQTPDTWQAYTKKTHVIGRTVSIITLVMLVGAPFLIGKLLGAYPDLGAVGKGFLSVGIVWLVSSIAEFLIYTLLQHLETSLDGVPVELHFFPCSMNNPIYHARLQKWFRRNADLQCSNIVGLPDGAGDIAIPTTAFNVIYQLTHLYHHFFDEGIGMRQIIDYYVVMDDFWKVKESFSKITPSLFTIKEGSTSHPDPLTLRGEGETAPSRRSEPLRSKVGGPSKVSPECLCGVNRLACDSPVSENAVMAAYELAALQRELKHLGLWKFAGAVMYVLYEVLGLSEEKMIAPMDEKRGKLLLAEILNGGNFGQHFTKYGHFTQQGMAKKYFLKIWRNMHFVRYYPAEALSEPIFRTWHFFWRLKNKK